MPTSNTGMTLDQVNTAIATYGPILCVHPTEAYQPCSVEWYVSRCQLLNKDNGTKTPASLDNLPATGNFQLIIDPAQGDATKKGNIATAKCYVNVKGAPGNEYTDIQFWFCYAYNGPGTARISVSGNNPCIANLAPLGEHEGDWEHVTMRFDNISLEPTLVYMSQHAGGTWYGIEQIERRGQKIVVYASKNGHAIYRNIGPNYSEHRKKGPITFDLVNETAGGGPELDGSVHYAIVASNYLPITSPSWVAFKGRFGKSSTEHMSPISVASILLAALDGWVKLLGPVIYVVASLVIPFFAKEDQDGPTPPSDKWSWTNDGEDSGDPKVIFVEKWRTTGLPNCGSTAMDFLVADLDGNGMQQVVQLWDHDGHMGMTVYGWNTGSNALEVTWSTGGLPDCGSTYTKVLVGDVNGDGKDEIVQCWQNNDLMGMIVYGGGSGGLSVLWSTGGLSGCGAGGEMLIANVSGDSAKEIVQLWDNGGVMCAFVYSWVDGGLSNTFRGDLSQGSGYTKIVVGDVNNDGRDEIIQCWQNGSQLGLIVYGWKAGDTLTTLWSTGDTGEGYGFADMLAMDINGDGKAELIQLWDNDGVMGVIVYGWADGQGMSRLWNTGNVGQGSGYTSLLTGDFLFDPSQEIVQTWNNDGLMGMILYDWHVTGQLLRTVPAETTGEGFGFVKMLSGRFRSPKSDVLQLWDCNGLLGMILYSARRISQ